MKLTGNYSGDGMGITLEDAVMDDGELNLNINHYKCEECGHEWDDLYSGMPDGDCPECYTSTCAHGATALVPCDELMTVASVSDDDLLEEIRKRGLQVAGA